MTTKGDRYSPVSILLHWLMAVLIVLAYLTKEFDDAVIGGQRVESWHYAIGFAILGLIWLRLLALLIWKPPLNDSSNVIARNAARLAHFALYVFMIAMPVAGWIAAGEEGDVIRIFGYDIPPLFAGNEGIAELGEELHEVGATAGYFLIGLHSLAALVHHFILRDDVLKMMLGRQRKSI